MFVCKCYFFRFPYSINPDLKTHLYVSLLKTRNNFAGGLKDGKLDIDFKDRNAGYKYKNSKLKHKTHNEKHKKISKIIEKLVA